MLVFSKRSVWVATPKRAGYRRGTKRGKEGNLNDLSEKAKVSLTLKESKSAGGKSNEEAKDEITEGQQGFSEYDRSQQAKGTGRHSLRQLQD